jgi:hypothetical protein
MTIPDRLLEEMKTGRTFLKRFWATPLKIRKRVLQELTVVTARKANAWLSTVSNTQSDDRRDAIKTDLWAAISMWLAECAADLRLPTHWLLQERERLAADLVEANSKNAAGAPFTGDVLIDGHESLESDDISRGDALPSGPDEFFSGVSASDFTDDAATDSTSTQSWKEAPSQSEEDILASDSLCDGEQVDEYDAGKTREVSHHERSAVCVSKTASMTAVNARAPTANLVSTTCELASSVNNLSPSEGSSTSPTELSSLKQQTSTGVLYNDDESPVASSSSNFGEKDAMMWFSTAVSPTESLNNQQECALAEESVAVVTARTVAEYAQTHVDVLPWYSGDGEKDRLVTHTFKVANRSSQQWTCTPVTLTKWSFKTGPAVNLKHRPVLVTLDSRSDVIWSADAMPVHEGTPTDMFVDFAGSSLGGGFRGAMKTAVQEEQMFMQSVSLMCLADHVPTTIDSECPHLIEGVLFDQYWTTSAALDRDAGRCMRMRTERKTQLEPVSTNVLAIRAWSYKDLVKAIRPESAAGLTYSRADILAVLRQIQAMEEIADTRNYKHVFSGLLGAGAFRGNKPLIMALQVMAHPANSGRQLHLCCPVKAYSMPNTTRKMLSEIVRDKASHIIRTVRSAGCSTWDDVVDLLAAWQLPFSQQDADLTHEYQVDAHYARSLARKALAGDVELVCGLRPTWAEQVGKPLTCPLNELDSRELRPLGERNSYRQNLCVSVNMCPSDAAHRIPRLVHRGEPLDLALVEQWLTPGRRGLKLATTWLDEVRNARQSHLAPADPLNSLSRPRAWERYASDTRSLQLALAYTVDSKNFELPSTGAAYTSVTSQLYTSQLSRGGIPFYPDSGLARMEAKFYLKSTSTEEEIRAVMMVDAMNYNELPTVARCQRQEVARHSWGYRQRDDPALSRVLGKDYGDAIEIAAVGVLGALMADNGINATVAMPAMNDLNTGSARYTFWQEGDTTPIVLTDDSEVGLTGTPIDVWYSREAEGVVYTPSLRPRGRMLHTEVLGVSQTHTVVCSLVSRASILMADKGLFDSGYKGCPSAADVFMLKESDSSQWFDSGQAHEASLTARAAHYHLVTFHNAVEALIVRAQRLLGAKQGMKNFTNEAIVDAAWGVRSLLIATPQLAWEIWGEPHSPEITTDNPVCGDAFHIPENVRLQPIARLKTEELAMLVTVLGLEDRST